MSTMEEPVDSFEVHGDPGAYRVSTDYIDKLKTQPLGYQRCMDLLNNDKKYDDSIKYLCWKVILNHIKNTYKLASPNDRTQMRDFLIRYIEAGDVQRRLDSIEISNIASRSFLMVFIQDYREHWKDFFSIICDSIDWGLRTVDNTVRIVHMITMWMAERPEYGSLISENEDLKHKFALKQIFKNQDICRILDFLCNVMKQYPELRATSMKCLQELMKFSDPIFFTYSPILETITGQLNDNEEWESSGNCLIQLVSARQTPLMSHKLLEKVLHIVEPMLVAATGSKNKLFVRKIGELHNAIEMTFLTGFSNAIDCSEFEETVVLQRDLESRLPHIQMYLNSPDYEISKSVHSCVIKYVQLLKERVTLTELQKEHLTVLFATCLQRIKMNLFFDITKKLFSDNFRDYRFKISTIMKSILNIELTFLMREISNELPKLSNWRVEKIPFSDLELPIYLIELLCDIVDSWPADLNLLDDVQRACVMGMPEIFQTLIQTRLNRHPHPAVVTQFFITISKGKKYFVENEQYLERVLSAFLIHIGPIEQAEIVRETCIELFSKLILELNPESLIRELDMLKMIRSFLAEDHLKHESMLSLYHAAAYIIQKGNFDNIQRKIYHLELMFPALNSFRVAVSEWHLTTEQNKPILAASICFTLTAITRTTLVYEDHVALEATGCVENYVKAFDIVQHCLSVVSNQREIHAAMVILVDRLIILLNNKLLPYIPTVVLSLFSSTDYQPCIEEASRLIIIMVDKYKTRMLPFLKEEFQRIGHSMYLCFEIAVHRTIGTEGKKKCLLFLERIYTTFVETLIRNVLYDDIFVEGDHLALLNLMFMIVAHCLPTLMVPEEKIKEYEQYLQSNVELIDFNAKRVAIEVKQMFHHRMYSGVYFMDM